MPILMPSPVFRWFVPANTGTGLVPAAGYKAKFYSAGTSTPKSVYDDNDTIYASPSNEVTLNSEGYAAIRLGEGKYKIVITDPFDVVKYTQDNISGEGSIGTGLVATVIASDDTGLKDVDPVNRFVWCSGYYAVGDGGHGFFWNETSSTPDDTGYVIASVVDSTKRWFRVPDEDGSVRAASFGYIGTKSGNLSSQLLAACAYSTSYNKRLLIGPGSTAIIGTDTNDFYMYTSGIHFENGSMLTGTGAFTNCVIFGQATGTPEPHFAGFQAKFQTAQANQNPEWFGGSNMGLDNTAAFAKWFACLPNGGVFVLPPGDWYYSNTNTFPYPTLPLLLYGTVHAASTGSNIPTGFYFPSDSRFRFHQALFNTGGTITDNGSGGFGVVGNILTSAGSRIDGGDVITSLGDMIAGFGAAAGKPYGRIGTSGLQYAASGQIYSYIGSEINTDPVHTEVNLLSFSLPAHSIIGDGDRLTLMIGGRMDTPANNINRRIRILIGTVTLFDVTLQPATGAGTTILTQWTARVELVQKSTTTFRAYGAIVTNYTNSGASVNQSSAACDINDVCDWTTTQVIQVKGTATGSGFIAQDAFNIDYHPAA
jgi:hypothetical protein